MQKQPSIRLSSGYEMPLFGLGMWLSDDENSVAVALETAIDLGYRLIDTAFAYKNEHFIGNTLKRIFQKGVVKREDLFIITKLPQNGLRPESVEYFFKKSLKALQLDYIDLYLIHGPMASKRTADDYEILFFKDGAFEPDTSVDLVETWRAMEVLVDKGLIRSIGLSNFNSQQIQRIYNAAKIKPANLQVECHAYLPQNEIFNFCKKLNISVTAYAPIGSPGFDEYSSKIFGFKTERKRLLDDERLKPICDKHQKSPAQVLLKFLVQRNICVIPKSSNPKRIKENIQIFDFTLDDDDMNILKSMGKNFRYFTFDIVKGLTDHPEYPFKIPF
ncbi:1,5-anhydro-D-fructose reductase-like isoform X2 [Uloborus diversus]|uniref:1,5-anhydro-D-fructose reductase-like isoform X2 n=1 Tax=Uloborus diversus TaxID=327109 RepID=UPI0024097A1D|nr:1,5-anhydro-D-fructose reductase-like isoform X2 [Uloborus diversus]